MMNGKIKVLVVDSHPIFCEALRGIVSAQPDMTCVAQAADSVQAIEEFTRHRPDITLMDERLVGQSGTEAMTLIKARFHHARIIILAAFAGDAEIRRALRAGAAAYLLKTIPQKELLDIIRQVSLGRRSMQLQVAIKLAEHIGSEPLTVREMEVLRLIKEGFSNKQIADRLSICETTVSFHTRNVVDKLEGNNRTHALAIALRRGLLPL